MSFQIDRESKQSHILFWNDIFSIYENNLFQELRIDLI